MPLPAALLRALLLVLLSVGLVVVPTATAPAEASVTHCVGYAGCRANGYSDAGYAEASGRLYWNMVSGHNCTNYAAYRMVRAGLPDRRPWIGVGDAHRWGHEMARITDLVPAVGAIAWWDSNRDGVGRLGHVAYVEKVISADRIMISEDIYDGDFHWRTIGRSDPTWPTGFIHFADERLRPAASSRVSGVVRVGERLEVGRARWTTAGVATSYQWLLDGRRVRGADDRRLTLTARMLGRRVAVRIEGRQVGYQPVSTTTRARGPVRLGRIDVRRRPDIRGTARVGGTLTLETGAWRPGGRETYRWFADARPIRRADGRRLVLRDSERGARITARVTVTKRGYRTASATARATDKVAAGGFVIRRAPVIVGTPQVGGRLHVRQGGWSQKPTRRAYLWYVGGQPLNGPGATYGSSLVMAEEYAGQVVKVAEVVARSGYEPAAAFSAPTAPVSPLTAGTSPRRDRAARAH